LQVGPETCLSARLAIYVDGEPEPKVEDVQGAGCDELIHRLCTRLDVVVREQHSELPQVALKALVQNLIHAHFCDVTISVLDGGSTVRVADHGPGIPDKQLAIQPGYSSARSLERRHIPGVGSGLAIAARLAAQAGGRLEIVDNLGGGAVVTMSMPVRPKPGARPDEAAVPQVSAWRSSGISDKGKRLLLLLAELGGASLATIADELRLSADAARAEVEALARLGLLEPREQNRIALTPAGLSQLEGIFVE
jgi:hypothetical protein